MMWFEISECFKTTMSGGSLLTSYAPSGAKRILFGLL